MDWEGAGGELGAHTSEEGGNGCGLALWELGNRHVDTLQNYLGVRAEEVC
jgi:hypothetical protein